MSKVNLTVSVANDHLKDFSDVAVRCRKAGMNITQEMKSIGMITGSIDESALEKLRIVKGVSLVELERSFQIAPPGSDVQ
ncbi:MAG TPA: ketohydroxyglutarate aldolase [Blastocatellia bacterium]|nr:ketohydroxyglutarate aldolase [Blastocatellia bacterium]